ncbi:MAG: ABC transporter ATP-binding protein, partial [Kiritimatiellia bacterium]
MREASFEVASGEFVLLTGPSGAGKTTLLNLLALLDTPTAGCLQFEGQATGALTESQRNLWRATRLGMVFQRFCLLPHRTALENVLFRFRYLPVPRHEAHACALAALESVGLAEQANRRARLLSAGEMQRVAIARAIAHTPRLLLADEPTGNLDHAAAEQVLAIFQRLHADGLTIVMVTHNESLLNIAARHLRCRNGCVEQDSLPPGILEGPAPCRPPSCCNRRELHSRPRARPVLRDLTEGLTLRPGRVLLVLGALAAGFAALTLLLSALTGLRNAAHVLQSELGAEVVAIVQAGDLAAGDGLLSETHLRCLRQNFPGWCVAGVRRINLAPAGNGPKVAALAASSAIAGLRGWRPVAGRLFDNADELDGARCAVATATACASHGWRPGDAITIGGQLFTLAGMLPDAGSTTDGAAGGLLVVPLSA